MRTGVLLIVVGFGALPVIGCAATRDSADYPFPEAQAELRQVLEDIINDVETANAVGLREGHLRTDKFTKFPGRTYDRMNFQQTIEVETGSITSKQDYKYEARDLKVDVFGDVGIVTYYPHRSYKLDGETVEYSARQTLVFLKTDDGWKIIHEHQSQLRDVE